MPRYHVVTLGCKLNQFDTARAEGLLRAQGYAPTADPGEAEVILLNTCTVTAAADRDGRRLARRLRRLNPGARIVATGCYAERDPETLSGLGVLDAVVGHALRHRLPAALLGGAERTGTAPVGAALCGGPPTRAPRRAGTEADPDRSPFASTLVGAATEGGPYGSAEPDEAVSGSAEPGEGAEADAGRGGDEAVSGSAEPDGGARPDAGRGGGEAACISAAPPVFSEDSARGWLRVQEGCDLACSYCIIPRVRGPGRSLPLAEILADARALAAQGVREIGLTGVNVGSWGCDLAPRAELADLLDALLAADLPLVLRFNSLEPRTVTPRIVERLAATPAERLAPHLQIPLQSGCDRVLGAMARNYRTADYRAVIDTLVARVPDVCLGADVIAGFPGETDAEHRATLAFVESLPLAYLHVFSYSARPGTRAAALPRRLPPDVVRARTVELRALGAEKRLAYRERMLGRALPALALGGLAADGWRRTLTSHYIEVLVPEAPPGAPLTVRLTRVEADGETVRGAVA
jgi:MiaB/RimO family radical SAM methylthiotransferase